MRLARWIVMLMVSASCTLLLDSADASAGKPGPYATIGMVRSSFAPNNGASHGFQRSVNLTAGLVFAKYQTPGSSIETGLILERRGGSWHSAFAPDGEFRASKGFARTLDLAYLAIPLRIRAGLSSGRIMPSIHAGMEAGYLIWARQTTADRQSDTRHSIDRSVRDELTSWEVAGTIGGRLATRWSTRSVFLELTYVHGLTSVDDGAFKIEGDIPGIANRGIRVTLGSSI
jgi:hypothetical protein